MPLAYTPQRLFFPRTPCFFVYSGTTPYLSFPKLLNLLSKVKLYKIELIPPSVEAETKAYHAFPHVRQCSTAVYS